MLRVIFAAFAPVRANYPFDLFSSSHAMNAYRHIANMPSTSPAKRDAGLCAPRLRVVFEGGLYSID